MPTKNKTSQTKSQLINKGQKQYPQRPEDWGRMPVVSTDTELLVGSWQVMQAWERPLMEVMAKEVTVSKGDILEVGFGMGISADAIIKQGCRSYTVIEAHPKIAAVAREWAKRNKTPSVVIEGLWQEVVSNLRSQFDGILFDTYPLSEEERHRNHFSFIPIAPTLLRPQGLLTYYSDESVNFSTEHIELLLSHFSEVKLVKVTSLSPYPDCEYWRETTMVVPVAKKIADTIE